MPAKDYIWSIYIVKKSYLRVRRKSQLKTIILIRHFGYPLYGNALTWKNSPNICQVIVCWYEVQLLTNYSLSCNSCSKYSLLFFFIATVFCTLFIVIVLILDTQVLVYNNTCLLLYCLRYVKGNQMVNKMNLLTFGIEFSWMFSFFLVWHNR